MPESSDNEIDAPFGTWNDDDDKLKPELDYYTCCPPPLFLPVISLAQISVFVYYTATLKNVSANRGGFDPNSPLIYDPVKRRQAWRFFSYSLLHSGWMHLLTNILLQLILGCILELQHKFWRVIPVYLLGVGAGSLASSVFRPSASLVGASGGAFALLGGHVATIIINWSEMQREWRKTLNNFLCSGVFRLGLIFIVVSSEIVRTICAYHASAPKQRTSFVAHFGGLLSGLLTGIFFLRNFKIRRHEKIVCVVSVIVYSLLVIAGGLFNHLCVAHSLCPRPSPDL